jgi:hypothetical protein
MGRSEAVRRLTRAREQFCGLGTRKAKLQLNRRALTCPVARALRLALEIEDASSLGKKYGGEWSYAYYEKKNDLIHQLITHFQAQGWIFGKHKSDGAGPKWIVYFEIPGCEQLSFHADLDVDIPDYPREWDGKVHSTLDKLEAAIKEVLTVREEQLSLEVYESVRS